MRRKYIYLAAGFFCLIAIIYGCSQKPKKSYKNNKFGLSFKMPYDWSQLSAAEKEGFMPGQEYLVSMGDSKRKAFVMLGVIDYRKREVEEMDFWNTIGISMSREEYNNLGLEEQSLISNYVLVGYGLTNGLADKYKEFRILDDRYWKLDGRWVREIICEGIFNEKEKNSRRIVLMFPPKYNNKILIMFMGVPSHYRDQYSKTFESILDSFEWTN